MGEKVHNVQPDAPKLSTTPLESLQPSPYFTQSLIGKYGNAALGAFIGGSSIAATNFFSKKPIISGLHRYPIAIFIGAAAVYQFQKYKEAEWAERDAIFRHYISLHPEDFPPYKRVKLGEVFDEWYPIR